MTRLKASCGCGWISTPAGQSKINTVLQAQEHTEKTGHTTEVHGIIRASKTRIIATPPLPTTQAAQPVFKRPLNALNTSNGPRRTAPTQGRQ